MKSRITIEVDFNNGNTPVIQILKAHSDDVRDKLISAFTECLGGSSWCNIRWDSVELGVPSRILITPIPPNRLKEESKIMLDQHLINEEWREKTPQ